MNLSGAAQIYEELYAKHGYHSNLRITHATHIVNVIAAPEYVHSFSSMASSTSDARTGGLSQSFGNLGYLRTAWTSRRPPRLWRSNLA